VRLGDTVVNALRESDVVDLVVSAAARRQGGTVVTPNLDHLERLARGPSPLTDAYDRASLVVADGQPLLWVAKLQGTPLPERVAGSSLLWTLSQAAARDHLAVMFIGGAPGSAARAGARLSADCAGLRVVDTMNPCISAPPTDVEIDLLVSAVEAYGPAIVFLGLGCPKQELIGLALSERLPEVWFLGVGAAFDMAGGARRRAPRIVQRMGLEWAFRLVQEPRRLAGRYLLKDLPFMLRLLRRAFKTRIHGRQAMPA
jgi:N-acetylglucosaminyldiphosphoundecaprenol N-acetyl-beta-D-mannosaminyltransferase